MISLNYLFEKENEKLASDVVEQNLNVILPNDYKKFINTDGYFSSYGVEVYGYKHGWKNNAIPSVIFATNSYKKDYKLSKDEIVISHSGYEDHIIILNTKTNNVYEVNMRNRKIKLANTFEEWLKNL